MQSVEVMSDSSCTCAHLYILYADDVAERFQRIVDAKTGTKSAVAIHWNRKGNSYHMHIVCSENEELPEPEPVKVREPLKRDPQRANAAGSA